MNPSPIDDGRRSDKYPAYAGVMVKSGNKVLLCKRRDDIPETTLPGYWSVPAGYVEPDEDIKTCAIRETKEETGIDIPQNETKFLAAYPSSDGEGVFYDYLFESPEDLVPTLDEEHSDWGYFGIDEIPNPITDEMRNDVILVLT
jgi:8-oxo-dGTP diphosphatase